jgi:hypothetical protein
VYEFVEHDAGEPGKVLVKRERADPDVAADVAARQVKVGVVQQACCVRLA